MALSKFSPSERIARKRVAARLRQQRCRARKRQQVLEQRGYRLISMGRSDLLSLPSPPSSPTMVIGNVSSSSSSTPSSQAPRTVQGKVFDSFEKQHSQRMEHSRYTSAKATPFCGSPMSTTSSSSHSIPSVSRVSSSDSSQGTSSSSSSLDGRCTTPVRNNLSPRANKEKRIPLPPPPPLTVLISSPPATVSTLPSLSSNPNIKTLSSLPTTRLKEVDAISAMLALSKQEATIRSNRPGDECVSSSSQSSPHDSNKHRPIQLNYKMRPFGDYYNSTAPSSPTSSMYHHQNNHHQVVHRHRPNDYSNSPMYEYGYPHGWHDSYSAARSPMPPMPRYTTAYST